MYIKRSQNALTVSKGVNMAIPFRPLGTWDIKVELGTVGALGVRDGDVLSMMNLSQYDAIGIVDLEDKASTYELTLVLMDGRQVRPTALGAIPGSDVVLSMSGTQLQITGNDLVEVTRWSDRSSYAPNITGYRFSYPSCVNLIKVPDVLPRWVTNLQSMFAGCTSFNQNLATWDMSNVTHASDMLRSCTNFNQDISEWVVSSIIDISGMFRGCTSFNQDLSTWNVSNVTEMRYMFAGCTNFNGDLSNWNVSNVKNMEYMFSGCSLYDRDMSGWDVSSVTNMSNMFAGCTSFNQILSDWCVSKIHTTPTDFSTDTPAWTLPKPVWGTCPPKPLRVKLLDGRTVTPTALGAIPGSDVVLSMTGSQIKVLGNDLVEVVGWVDRPTYAPTATGYTFQYCSNLVKVPKSIPKWITNYYVMFSTCTNFNSDLSEWDTSAATNMSHMFAACPNFNSDLSMWDTSNVTDMGYMFHGCTSFNQDLSGWCVSKMPTAQVEFNYNTPAWTLPKPVWGTCPPRAMAVRLSSGRRHRISTIGNVPDSNVTITSDSNQLRISGSDVIEVLEWHQASPDETYVKGYQFVDCTGLIKVPATIPGWITKLSDMFYGCNKFNQDLSGWVTTNVTDMHRMFYGATMFNKPLNTWNVSNVTDMEGLFYGCNAFNQNLPSWDTSKVTTIRGMFTGCTAFNGDIDMWVTDAVTNMEATFQDCVNFNRDLSMWCVGNLATQPTWFKDGAVAWTLPKPEWGTCPIRQIVLHTDGEKSNFNVYSYFGNPTEVTDYVLVVDHEISSSGYATPALQTGTFPSGSTLTIVNNSYIRGAGGNATSGAGQPGGSAIYSTYPITIDNTNGYIWAGGGGGATCNLGSTLVYGGGGGAGKVSGAGYRGGSASGGAGTLTTGGPGGVSSYRGGNGGGCGLPGGNSTGLPNGNGTYAGGRGGYSIQRNGNALTWVGGNDATRVKGAIV